MDFTPVAGDTAGNNLKWDSMKIEVLENRELLSAS